MLKILIARPSHKIQRRSISEALAESLRGRILNGELKEGTPLIQEAIAAEYEVSRMPVREAFRQLEASGFIASRIHKGAIVTGLPLEQIHELFDLRVALECELLAHAIPGMTAEHLGVSEAVLPELEAAYLSQDVLRWGALNWEFHRSLYVPSEKVQTLAIAQGVNQQTDRYIRLQLVLTENVSTAISEHRQLLKLCGEGNVQEAVSLLRDHIFHAGVNLKRALQQAQMKVAI
ncbi:GntR family transcriptional regulator [Pseudomonas fulva]|uniref:GntR family transcriptional regulator n=1 Tax=Pseudomonas fulva TaxID=47880 RepID=UPI00201DD999|nr:GntR family transcriptional regulator [Pseudomonas fulva]UQY33025.1 GntR family transcriptional regulator [Pseudomonas fulva]